MSRITARKLLKSIRTARSAVLAVGGHLIPMYQNSGRNCTELRESYVVSGPWLGQPTAPEEPDTETVEEIARIEQAILVGDIRVLGEFGGLRPLAARGQDPRGIRAAMHPRWTAPPTRLHCSVYFTNCHVLFTVHVPEAPLFVAFRTHSPAIRLSRRLANAAPRRSRCSRGFIHGLLGNARLFSPWPLKTGHFVCSRQCQIGNCVVVVAL